MNEPQTHPSSNFTHLHPVASTTFLGQIPANPSSIQCTGQGHGGLIRHLCRGCAIRSGFAFQEVAGHIAEGGQAFEMSDSRTGFLTTWKPNTKEKKGKGLRFLRWFFWKATFLEKYKDDIFSCLHMFNSIEIL